MISKWRDPGVQMPEDLTFRQLHFCNSKLCLLTCRPLSSMAKVWLLCSEDPAHLANILKGKLKHEPPHAYFKFSTGVNTSHVFSHWSMHFYATAQCPSLGRSLTVANRGREMQPPLADLIVVIIFICNSPPNSSTSFHNCPQTIHLILFVFLCLSSPSTLSLLKEEPSDNKFELIITSLNTFQVPFRTETQGLCNHLYWLGVS